MAKQSEHSEQVALFDWFFLMTSAYPELDLAFATPNGIPLSGSAKSKGRVINYMKAEGLRPGAPDIVLPVARGGYMGLFVEMKAIGGRLSENQEQYLAQAREQGYLCIVPYGFEQAQEWVEQYLALPPTLDLIRKAYIAIQGKRYDDAEAVLDSILVRHEVADGE